MAWLISISIDPDKTNVGTATATFTDTDATTFVYTQRALLTVANATSFATAAIAARNAWQAQKTRETSAMSTLVSSFTTAGEVATADKAI